MGIDGDDIRAAMLNPRHTYTAGAGREYRTRGKVTLVVTTEVPAVIVTVLWGTVAAWQEDHDSIGSREERSQRHITRLRAARKAQKKGRANHYR